MLSTLVVDDDPIVAATLARFVRHVPGFRVDAVVGSAAEARQAARHHRPRLVLLDLHLPDANGLDLAARLRRDHRDLDVIVITGRRDLMTVRAAMQSGALHYLVKPVRLDDLSRLLHRYRQLDQRLSAPHAASQDEIDALFRVIHDGSDDLPKNMTAETLRLVHQILQDGGEHSAQEAAQRLNISRPTAGRYLEHLVSAGQAQRTLAYGSRGRPQHRYRLRGNPFGAPSTTDSLAAGSVPPPGIDPMKT
ncbi:response regulator [Dactylosporangium darangshiense]|uniref:Transcriptional regulatory protein n=1 Tax=Dactylosporangium darangshiense TaxID=579108 RepID=A0ABP8DTK7_9ACTN